MVKLRVVVHKHKEFSMGVGGDKEEMMFDSETDIPRKMAVMSNNANEPGFDDIQQIDFYDRPRLSSLILTNKDGVVTLEFDVYDEVSK